MPRSLAANLKVEVCDALLPLAPRMRRRFVSPLFASPDRLAFAPSAASAKITWTPAVVDQTLAPGSVSATVVTFSSSDTINNASLSFTPSLQDVLAISPTGFSTVAAGISNPVNLTEGWS
jgi:hypothetical protein